MKSYEPDIRAVEENASQVRQPARPVRYSNGRLAGALGDFVLPDGRSAKHIPFYSGLNQQSDKSASETSSQLSTALDPISTLTNQRSRLHPTSQRDATMKTTVDNNALLVAPALRTHKFSFIGQNDSYHSPISINSAARGTFGSRGVYQASEGRSKTEL